MGRSTKTRTPARTEDPNQDLIDARTELCRARAALAMRDDDTNRSRLAYAREWLDVLLDQALEADCT
jgi:hypothetical protein